MTKQDFFKFLLNDFFEERTCRIKDLNRRIGNTYKVLKQIK